MGEQAVSMYAHLGNTPAENPAQRGQYDAFDEKLADDAPSSGAKCDANGKFARTADRTRQQQIRQIGAGNQEHEANRAPHGLINHGCVGADKKFVEIEDMRKQVSTLIGRRIGGCEAAADGLHLSTGSGARNAGLQVAEDEPGVAVVPLQNIAGGNQGHPHVLVLREGEVPRHDADQGCGGAVDLNLPADRAGIFSIAPLPEAVAKDGDLRSARRFVRR